MSEVVACVFKNSSFSQTYIQPETEPLTEELEDLSQVIKKRFGHHLLKLESTFNTPNKSINEIVDELQFISCCASGPVIMV